MKRYRYEHNRDYDRFEIFDTRSSNSIPIAHCWEPDDAERIVEALNATEPNNDQAAADD